MTTSSPFKYFKTSPEIIRLAVMYYIRYPLSFRQVEDILHERGVDICHETVRFWWNKFGPMFAAEIRRNLVSRMLVDDFMADRQGFEPWERVNVHNLSKVAQSTTLPSVLELKLI